MTSDDAIKMIGNMLGARDGAPCEHVVRLVAQLSTKDEAAEVCIAKAQERYEKLLELHAECTQSAADAIARARACSIDVRKIDGKR